MKKFVVSALVLVVAYSVNAFESWAAILTDENSEALLWLKVYAVLACVFLVLSGLTHKSANSGRERIEEFFECTIVRCLRDAPLISAILMAVLRFG